MFRIPFSILFLAGCNDVYLAPDLGDAAERAQTGTCEPWGGTYSGVVFTDEQAQNAIDFVDHATSEELQVLIGIGPSIANRVITARPFGTQADPVASLDAVSYVGPYLLNRLKDDSYGLWCGLDDGRQDCCIDLACDGLGGTFSGVELSDAEGQMILDWANRATSEQLEAACGVGPAIAADIRAARPMHDVAELDAVPYVSTMVLSRLAGREGYDCVTDGSVAEVWCDQDGACTCDVADPVDPPSGGETFDRYLEGPWELPSELQADLDVWLTVTDWCESNLSDTPSYMAAVEHHVNGEIAGYSIELMQMTGNEELYYVVQIDVDADLQYAGHFCEM